MSRPLLSIPALAIIGLSAAPTFSTQTSIDPPIPYQIMAAPKHEAPQPVEIGITTDVVSTPTPTPIPPARPISGSWQDWFRAAGVLESDWTAAYAIMMKESGGRPNAINASSGACGLFQQLPCGKWAHPWNDPVGAVIDASSYARSRYGGWKQAWSAWSRQGWW
jgi:hypothetical protein